MFIAFGLALVSNFRGFAAEYARRSLAGSRPISDLLRRNRTAEAMQRRVVMVTVVNRLAGLGFAVGGLVLLIALFTRS